MTIIVARKASTSSATIVVIQNAGPWPRSFLNTTLSTMLPIRREATNTKVFTTPWISVSVTMSPFATWLTSWPSTASTSLRFMRCRSPVLTATSDLSRRAPVAKAFGAGESK